MSLLYVIAYLGLLVAPGLVLAVGLRFPPQLLILSAVSLSYSLFVVTALVFKWFGGAYEGLTAAWLILAVLATVIGAVLARRHGNTTPRIIRVPWVAVATMAAVLAYLWLAGPYLEVPSDHWWHLGKFQKYSEIVSKGMIDSAAGWNELFKPKNEYWYLFHVLLCRITGSELTGSLNTVCILNTLLFLSGVYGFTLYIFRHDAGSTLQRNAIAAVAVLFFILHFGISVFSYVRYYALAPTMLNYVVYLGMAGLFIYWLDETSPASVVPVILFIAFPVLWAVHKQEAMFLGLALASMAGVVFLRNLWRIRQPGWRQAIVSSRLWRERQFVISALFAVALLIYLVVHAYAYLNFTRHTATLHGRVINIENIAPFFRNLYILDPTVDFYKVVTVWGLFIFALYLKERERFRGNTYINAMMWLPLLTIFNPVFVDFFLRFSWPEVMWRITYMLPLPFVAAYLAVHYARSLAAPGAIMARLGNAVALLLLAVLLFPINTRFVQASEYRWPTLVPVAATNDHRLWADLLSELRSYPEMTILTDRVTGYVINGMTGHHYPGYKFYGRGALPTYEKAYTEAVFDRYGYELVVINLRDGAPSLVGKLSRHWPENVMRVTDLYSPEFMEFIRGNPRRFALQWSNDRISIYRVNRIQRIKADG